MLVLVKKVICIGIDIGIDDMDDMEEDSDVPVWPAWWSIVTA